MHRLSIATPLTLGAALLVTACGGQAQPVAQEPVAAAADVVIVAGAHANAPKPVFTLRAEQVIDERLAEGARFAVIVADGKPGAIPLDLRELRGEESAQTVQRQANKETLLDAIQTPPDDDGAFGWGGVGLAADALRGGGGPRPTMIVVLPGLDDTGVLDRTTPGALGADPDETVAFLRGQPKGLPELTGITVILTGIGSTAAPQEPLDPATKAILTDSWARILTAAGAEVVIDPTPISGPSVVTDKTVREVALPAPAKPEACVPSEFVFDGNSRVRFHPQSPVFLDRSAARAALTDLGRWLAANPARTADIRGTTARDGQPLADLRGLGEDRARAVADLLIELGARPAQLRVSGVGYEFPEYIDDQAPGGGLDPVKASANRSVRITTHDAC